MPKLKYYYYAMNMSEYYEFEKTRRLTVDATLRVDINTGAVTGRPHLVLVNTGNNADTLYRIHHRKDHGIVRVLRIPAGVIDRRQLKPVPAEPGSRIQAWTLNQSLTVPECSVEQFDVPRTPVQ